MRPFDIELWKAGEPVITRSGQEVKDLTYFDTIKSTHKLVGTVNGSLQTWLPEGYFISENHNSDFDLFHPQNEMWVNVYNRGDIFVTGDIYNSETDSKNKILAKEQYIGTFKLVKP